MGTSILALRDGKLLGTISLADVPRPEAASSLRRMRKLGVSNIIMFTGDNLQTAQRIAKPLGVTRVQADMKPEDKVRELEQLPDHPVIMVGDGINDAPALARADVGVAMGKSGSAITSEAADVIFLADNLNRLADIVSLGRRTKRVIAGDVVLWTITNTVGYALVLMGIFNPAWAAFYNFATDFIPIINSSRLFRGRSMLP